MENLKEKKKNTELLVVENKKGLAKVHKENKVIKIITNILLKISKLILKLTVIVAIYGMIFSVVVYYSNQFMVNKLREAEANKKVDPVLEALKNDKDNEKEKEDEKDKAETNTDEENQEEENKEEKKTDKEEKQEKKKDEKKKVKSE